MILYFQNKASINEKSKSFKSFFVLHSLFFVLQELEKKFSQTVAYKNMKMMLSTKNDQVIESINNKNFNWKKNSLQIEKMANIKPKHSKPEFLQAINCALHLSIAWESSACSVALISHFFYNSIGRGLGFNLHLSLAQNTV